MATDTKQREPDANIKAARAGWMVRLTAGGPAVPGDGLRVYPGSPLHQWTRAQDTASIGAPDRQWFPVSCCRVQHASYSGSPDRNTLHGRSGQHRGAQVRCRT